MPGTSPKSSNRCREHKDRTPTQPLRGPREGSFHLTLTAPPFQPDPPPSSKGSTYGQEHLADGKETTKTYSYQPQRPAPPEGGQTQQKSPRLR